MIPKIIHYCWFGRNPLPKSAIKCINSWKHFFPDYEIKEWNEDNFNVNIIPYTEEAYKAKKYAFVSDYARFWILYKYGGIYFDTDVEVVKNMDDIISKGSFMGCENDANESVVANVAPGLGIGSLPNLPIYKEIIKFYEQLNIEKSLNKECPETVVTITTRILKKYGLLPTNQIQRICNILIYPKEYFCPLDYTTGNLTITNNTYSIHHYTASWLPKSIKFKNYIKKTLYKNQITKTIIQKIKHE